MVDLLLLLLVIEGDSILDVLTRVELVDGDEGLLANHIKDRVNKLGSFRVVTLSPVVTSASLAENEIIRAEELSEWPSTHGVHDAGLEVHQNGAGDVATTSSLVVVNIDSFKL